MKIKRCTKCRKRKSLIEFYKDKYAKDGFRSQCKKCSDDYHRKYYRIHKNEIVDWYKKYAKTNQSKQAKKIANKKYRQTTIGHLCRCFHMMKNRCNNSKIHNYNCYGGRGIKLKFKNADEFINYVLCELQVDPRRLQIDRIDNNGHYERGNIRFVTAKINSNNRRNQLGEQKC